MQQQQQLLLTQQQETGYLDEQYSNISMPASLMLYPQDEQNRHVVSAPRLRIFRALAGGYSANYPSSSPLFAPIDVEAIPSTNNFNNGFSFGTCNSNDHNTHIDEDNRMQTSSAASSPACLLMSGRPPLSRVTPPPTSMMLLQQQQHRRCFGDDSPSLYQALQHSISSSPISIAGMTSPAIFSCGLVGSPSIWSNTRSTLNIFDEQLPVHETQQELHNQGASLIDDAPRAIANSSFLVHQQAEDGEDDDITSELTSRDSLWFSVDDDTEFFDAISLDAKSLSLARPVPVPLAPNSFTIFDELALSWPTPLPSSSSPLGSGNGAFDPVSSSSILFE